MSLLPLCTNEMPPAWFLTTTKGQCANLAGDQIQHPLKICHKSLQRWTLSAFSSSSIIIKAYYVYIILLYVLSSLLFGNSK